MRTTPNESFIPRPGGRFGPYPERGQPPRPWPVFTAAVWRAKLRQAKTPSRREQVRFLAKIHAMRARLGGCSFAFLTAVAKRVRARLATEGLMPELIAEMFALLDACLREQRRVTLHDSQLLAAWFMLDRRLVEMETGEGKTLAIALAAATCASAGMPVHVITANDYLVVRDAAAQAPLFAFLGLRVGAVTASTQPSQRGAIYQCDIVYCMAKELAFDYLRDRIAAGLDRWQAAKPASRLLRGLCMAIIDEADSILVDEACMPLILSVPEADGESPAYYRQALFLANQLKPGDDYAFDDRRRRAELTHAGQRKAQQLAGRMGGAWCQTRRREEALSLALAAQHLYLKDCDYLVEDRKIVIIDEPTGRQSNGRSWSRGLHQLIEAKERCPMTPTARTVARTSYQHFFSRYLRLSGISGTLAEAAGLLSAVYGLPVLRVPLHRPGRRMRLPARVFATKQDRWRCVVERAQALRRAGRPVLIGTASVCDSEALSACLAQAGVPHHVLNARHDAAEANVIAAAGQAGAITVATNMAGRGTDIALGPGVAERGGLHVIACQANRSRRIDRQLYGRCARQGDPGSVEQFHVAEAILPAFALRFLTRASGSLPAWCGLLAALARRRREQALYREQWLQYVNDEAIDRQLIFDAWS